MRTYELVLIFDPNLEMEQTEAELKRVQEMLVVGGSTRKWERWGKRRLAYEIRGRQYGYYAVAVFDSNPAAVAELDRLVRISPTVLRHLITSVPTARIPEVDLEAVRTLGATAPAVVEEVDPEAMGEAAVVLVDAVPETEVPAVE